MNSELNIQKGSRLCILQCWSISNMLQISSLSCARGLIGFWCTGQFRTPQSEGRFTQSEKLFRNSRILSILRSSVRGRPSSQKHVWQKVLTASGGGTAAALSAALSGCSFSACFCLSFLFAFFVLRSSLRSGTTGCAGTSSTAAEAGARWRASTGVEDTICCNSATQQGDA